MSPVYKNYFNAVDESLNNRSIEKKAINLDEEHDKLSLSSLSQTLVGLYE